MTLTEFATKAGVTIHRCDKSWGGTFAYKEKEAPNVLNCGYRTTTSAYKAWLADSLGDGLAKTIIDLLDKKEFSNGIRMRKGGS